MSLRAYARHRKALGLPGGTLRAVQAAIASGRITATDGQIAAAEQADREWAGSTHADHVPLRGPTPHAAPPPSAPNPLLQHRVRREAAAAERAEFELAQLKGEYIRRDVVREDVMHDYRICRDQLLAIPSKLGQRGVPIGVIAVVDDMIRTALEELADGKAHRRVSAGGGE